MPSYPKQVIILLFILISFGVYLLVFNTADKALHTNKDAQQAKDLTVVELDTQAHEFTKTNTTNDLTQAIDQWHRFTAKDL
ncbi:hypothetical protein ISG33_15315 [Glaciecola sp. MH2013]|uniref:hypothetical protein n=1 Tax=Glaciecola sp. MH2013 TaxID=2785524 RepID=UPI00189E34F5|nr:hypothetical protein [Glaciecola sp. MH2013]MBF7074770.1 hypothetical protein [Glaciecola sp. MH2013]